MSLKDGHNTSQELKGVYVELNQLLLAQFRYNTNANWEGEGWICGNKGGEQKQSGGNHSCLIAICILHWCFCIKLVHLGFFHSLPAPEFGEWIFPILFRFPNFGIGIIHSRSRS